MAKVWAVPTWLFLHTMAAKLNEAKYPAAKQDLLYHVKNLCAVLPCPDCAQHAVAFMAGVELKHVPTKEAFKTLLWRFHNSVNARTGKPAFPTDKMTIYNNCNLTIMYGAFVAEFSKPSHNPKLMMDAMGRATVIAKFMNWMGTPGLFQA